MKVVLVDGDVSYPATSGKCLRILNLMVRLAEQHEMTYLARTSVGASELREAECFFRDHGIRVHFVEDPLPNKTGLGFYRDLAANLFSSLPYSVAIHRSRVMKRAVDELAANDSVDIWQCEWSGYLNCLAGVPYEKRVCVAHNVDSVIWRRHYESEPNPLRRLYIREQWRKFEAFERSVFQESARVVAVTDEDAVRLSRDFRVANVAVVENGVDCDYYTAVQPAKQGSDYLFLGSLDWRPNQDAVRWLLDSITPQIMSRNARARLHIVGRRPPLWMQQRVAAAEGVELHADVDDVRPYLRRSRLMIVPLRIGGGSRLKILEALASELPVVSTAVGAEGLRLSPGEHYLEGNCTEELVDLVLATLTPSASTNTMTQAGYRLVRQEYEWDGLANRLNDVWMSTTPLLQQS